MQPAGNEKHGPPSFPARPANSPFMAAPPTSMPSSSGPVVRSEPLGYRAAPPARFNGPNIPSRPSNIPTDAGSYQRTPTPQFSSSAQPAPPFHGPPIAGRPVLAQHVQPSMGQQSVSSPAYFHPQTQIPSLPMGPPPQSSNVAPLSMNVHQSTLESSFPSKPVLQPPMPPLESSVPAARPTTQPSLHGYPDLQTNMATHVPQAQSTPLLSHQGGYIPAAPLQPSPYLSYRGGYVPPPLQQFLVA